MKRSTYCQKGLTSSVSAFQALLNAVSLRDRARRELPRAYMIKRRVVGPVERGVQRASLAYPFSRVIIP